MATSEPVRDRERDEGSMITSGWNSEAGEETSANCAASLGFPGLGLGGGDGVGGRVVGGRGGLNK